MLRFYVFADVRACVCVHERLLVLYLYSALLFQLIYYVYVLL